MNNNIKIIDGNEAAAYIAYAFTEVAGIYPITPSSPIAEKIDEWAAADRKNIFGQTVRLVEMQSEAGAAGVVHGALETGSLAASFTSSQGLMLMIPTMHRISGQRHPGVLHVAARTVGTHAFSIFGDHSDVMNCRQTGFAMLSTGSVQEVMDLAGIAHLAAIKSRIPFLHFFDGFRTSHEMQKVETLQYEDLAKLLDKDALEAFRKNAINPEEPVMRSTVQNPDVYFQVREANNQDYDQLPEVVQDYMEKITKLTGRKYELFQYYGAADADRIIIAMGSVSGTAREVVDYLNKRGEKVGFLQIHLFRPFSKKHLLQAIPDTVKKVAVLDRLKEIGSLGEPLYEDICTAYINEREKPYIYAGRYGLSSKDTAPTQIKAVFDNLKLERPKDHFTIGIEDDVTFLSLQTEEEIFTEPEGTISCKFWGLGSDGTVGANKNSIKIIGDSTDMYCQAYFEYDTKKSFGCTKSHLRFGNYPIDSSYYVRKADFVACHNQFYLEKYDIITELKRGGTFLLNCSWPLEELVKKIPEVVRTYIKENDISFYIIDANKVSKELGLGNRANMVLQSAFFTLAKIIPADIAIKQMKEAVEKTYSKKGESIVAMNLAAIDAGKASIVKVTADDLCKTDWKTAKAGNENDEIIGENRNYDMLGQDKRNDLEYVIENLLIPINKQKGDEIPVSKFMGMKDGTMPLGTSAFEKRGIASQIPLWNKEHCLQCNQCSFVCPHAVIRPFLLSEEEAGKAPETFEMTDAKGGTLKDLKYSIQVSKLDCTSCGCCIESCPAKGKALRFIPAEEAVMDQNDWNYALTVSDKSGLTEKFAVKGSQFVQPLLEFSGACAGCGETPYVKLLTQLYGDKMYFANGTGCLQAWGAAMPCMPYTSNKEGKGPAWSNSLFENNAEFSYGMCLSVKQQRENVAMDVKRLQEKAEEGSELEFAIAKWQETYDDLDASAVASRNLTEVLQKLVLQGESKEIADAILQKKNHLSKKTMWMVGGDGWAYDIGYGGLDHVFAMGEDVNVLVVDTEVYSNTGGQSSKATPIGAVAQFQSSGKKTGKKDLGLLMMAYDNVYVAQCVMGANPNQLIKAFKEAVEHKGPSIIIVYAPCINHGIKAGMEQVGQEMKNAVDSGYWCLYRYHPETKEFFLDSKEPSMDLKTFLQGEVRYSSLELTFPENAEKLFAEAEKSTKSKYETYRKLSQK